MELFGSRQYIEALGAQRRDIPRKESVCILPPSVSTFRQSWIPPPTPTRCAAHSRPQAENVGSYKSNRNGFRLLKRHGKPESLEAASRVEKQEVPKLHPSLQKVMSFEALDSMD